MERMPFRIQRIQTDRGQEFFVYEVQERLMEYGIKFRPIKPASPHLNGKYVELIYQTPLHEEVNEKYDPSKEHILIHGYNKNLATKILKYTISIQIKSNFNELASVF
jgi:transposase InsO family protein